MRQSSPNRPNRGEPVPFRAALAKVSQLQGRYRPPHRGIRIQQPFRSLSSLLLSRFRAPPPVPVSSAETTESAPALAPSSPEPPESSSIQKILEMQKIFGVSDAKHACEKLEGIAPGSDQSQLLQYDGQLRGETASILPFFRLAVALLMYAYDIRTPLFYVDPLATRPPSLRRPDGTLVPSEEESKALRDSQLERSLNASIEDERQVPGFYHLKLLIEAARTKVGPSIQLEPSELEPLKLVLRIRKTRAAVLNALKYFFHPVHQPFGQEKQRLPTLWYVSRVVTLALCESVRATGAAEGGEQGVEAELLTFAKDLVIVLLSALYWEGEVRFFGGSEAAKAAEAKKAAEAADAAARERNRIRADLAQIADGHARGAVAEGAEVSWKQLPRLSKVLRVAFRKLDPEFLETIKGEIINPTADDNDTNDLRAILVVRVRYEMYHDDQVCALIGKELVALGSNPRVSVWPDLDVFPNLLPDSRNPARLPGRETIIKKFLAVIKNSAKLKSNLCGKLQAGGGRVQGAPRLS